jgi:uncharacterized protein (UPF0276 family)
VKNLGFGIGLRSEHYQDILSQNPPIDWLEIISETYMLPGGKSRYYLDLFKERYPIIPHGVSLSIGSSDPIDWAYLKELKKLITHLDPPWFSDHLCWSKHAHQNLHNLMPLPYTEDVITYVAERIRIIQDFIEKPMLVENVSSYVEFTDSDMPEWTFISQIAEKANCGILLDINNIYVSAFNHNFNPQAYLDAMPAERVFQFHIAGHTDKGTYLLDTHDHAVKEGVWDLYKQALNKFDTVSTMIERDDNIPELSELLDELHVARRIWETHHGK